MKLLVIGDVVGEAGIDALHGLLRRIKRDTGADFVIVNGENAAGNGVLPRQADDIFAAGADVITLGNHVFGKQQMCADRILKENEGMYDVALAEIHANATSEKLAMGYYLDGRAAAVWGTHTHVQTADERVNPKGTGYITDIGMTGPIVSVLGVRVEQSIAMFRGDLTEYFKTAEGDCAVSGALFDITRNGKCNSVTRVWERWNVR